MRKTISGMVAAVAVMMTAGAAPAMACGGGLFTSCSPCAYAAPARRRRSTSPRPRSIRAATPAAAAGPMSGCPIRCINIILGQLPVRATGRRDPSIRRTRCPSIVTARTTTAIAHRHYGCHHAVRPSVRYGYAPRYGMPRHGMMSRHGMHHGGAMMMRHHGHQGHRNHVRRYY